MTFYVLGLTITSPQGLTWSVAPHVSGLPSAEGGFETALGWFGVKWVSTTKRFELNITTPAGTSGVVKLPLSGTVSLGGKPQDNVGEQISLVGGSHVLIVQQ